MPIIDLIKSFFSSATSKKEVALSSVPTYKDFPLIRQGHKNEYVIRLKEQLTKNGFYKGKINDVFDDQTYDSVIHFQQTQVDENGNELTVDGIVAKDTWWALYNTTAVVKKEEKKNKGTLSIIPDGISASRKQVLELAKNEIGNKEIPDGSNWGAEVRKYLEYCGFGPAPWCAMFVTWVIGNALKIIPWKSKIAHVATLYNTCKKLGMSHSVSSGYKPRPGDLFIMVHGDNTGHIGIISRVSENCKQLNVIEGNSGNRVALRTRTVGANDHVGYINYLSDENSSYDFEKGIIIDTDNAGLTSTR